jgi:hypothetical protein
VGSNPRLERPLKIQQIRSDDRACVRPATGRSSRANENIPSRRHRLKTAPREQSIRFPLCNLTCKRKRDWSATFGSLLYYSPS